MSSAVDPLSTQQSGSEMLAKKFTDWLNKFSLDKEIRKHALFRRVDDHFLIDLGVARSVTTKGVRADGVAVLVDVLGLETRERVADVLGLSGVTLWRLARDKKPLSEIQTEQIVRAMDLQMTASEVFGNIESAQKWLNKPHPSLDGEAPMAYASNEYGAQKVRGMLAALRYGGVA